VLFDLKGRRKRLVQVVYLFLAILFGGGLILFGVGSDVQGGLVDALKGNSGSNVDTSAFEDRVDAAEQGTKADPKNDKAWLALARAEYNLAVAGDDYDREVGAFKAGATDELEKAVRAWERYLALKPKNPNTGVAALMVQAYGGLVSYNVGGSPLDVFRNAARTQRVIATERPSPIAYYQLALIYYAIGDIKNGDKAADKSVALTPKDQRNTVTAQLKDARKDGVKAKKEVAKSEEQAAKAAREARKSGQDPFGAQPGQQPLGTPSP
jgi:tetratricopeptide (TPR) repeat protein